MSSVISTLLSFPFSQTICHIRSSQNSFLFVAVDVAAVRELIADKTKELYTVVQSQLLPQTGAPGSVCKTTWLPVKPFLLRTVADCQTHFTCGLDELGKKLKA
jgi:hypothetical protein